MTHVELVEQTFRDGQQSLWGMRLRAGMVQAVAQDLDEELLLRYMVPLEDLQATRAAGPLNPTYHFHDTTKLRDFVDDALALRRPRYVRIARGDLDLTLRRSGAIPTGGVR